MEAFLRATFLVVVLLFGAEAFCFVDFKAGVACFTDEETGFAIFVREDFSLDALFLWIRLFFAALSTIETALATALPDFVFFAVRREDLKASRSASFFASRFLSFLSFLIADLITGIKNSIFRTYCIPNLVILTWIMPKYKK